MGNKDQSEHTTHNAVHDSCPATGCQNLPRLMAGRMKMSLLEWWNVDDNNNKGDHTVATDDSQNGMTLGTKT